MAAAYLQGTDAALLVHDAASSESLSDAEAWLELLVEAFSTSSMPHVALISAKADDERAEAASCSVMCDSHRLASLPAYVTSAATGRGVIETFSYIAADLAGLPQEVAEGKETLKSLPLMTARIAATDPSLPSVLERDRQSCPRTKFHSFCSQIARTLCCCDVSTAAAGPL